MSGSDQYNTYSSNPNLLNPVNNGQQTVPGAPNITKALPVVLNDKPSYYSCTMPNHHMHRTDGKRLAFLFGILKTFDVYDIAYVEQEILSGNPFVRLSTVEEVQFFNMKTDPRGTMTRELTPEIENKVRVELEIKLREEMESKLKTVGISLTEEQRNTLDKLMAAPASDKLNDEGSDVGDSASDGKNIGTVDALSRLRANFEGSLKIPSGTLVHSNPTASLQSSIVGTDRLANAGDSNSETVSNGVSSRGGKK